MKKTGRKTKRTESRTVSKDVSYESTKRGSKLAIEGDPVIIVGVGRDPACSPLEIEMFVPWICKQWNVSTSVVITPKLEEFRVGRTTDYDSGTVQQLLKKYRRVVNDDIRRKSKELPDVSNPTEEINISESSTSNKSMLMNVLVPVTAYYDTRKRLVEIAIVGSANKPSRKVIAAFSLCVPYHSSLTRFTYRKSGLTAALIYEINKLLPVSNISEIILDDSNVPEANYYILLEEITQLKYLSLNRCKINDAPCKKIFENIQFNAPAANSLQIIELGSNDITDDAAIFIGSVLRANRKLIHLNLSGNKITDSGFVPILDSLMEFPLNFKEKLDSRRRKLNYLKSKVAVYERCLSSLKCRNLENFDSGTKKSLKGVHSKSTSKISEHNFKEEAEVMAKGILGEFHDTFSPDNVVVKNEATYSKGNFVLCYINLAYNNLENLSVQRLHDVLQYQDDMRKNRQLGKGKTGLIKVTLDGNHIPTTCSIQLEEINLYLRNVLISRSTASKSSRFVSLGLH